MYKKLYHIFWDYYINIIYQFYFIINNFYQKSFTSFPKHQFQEDSLHFSKSAWKIEPRQAWKFPEENQWLCIYDKIHWKPAQADMNNLLWRLGLSFVVPAKQSQETVKSFLQVQVPCLPNHRLGIFPWLQSFLLLSLPSRSCKECTVQCPLQKKRISSSQRRCCLSCCFSNPRRR